MDRESLAEWAKDKPLSILQLDPADRAVLRIAGEFIRHLLFLDEIFSHFPIRIVYIISKISQLMWREK